MPEHKHGCSDLVPQFPLRPEIEPVKGFRLQSGSPPQAGEEAADLAVWEASGEVFPVGPELLRHWQRLHQRMPLRLHRHLRVPPRPGRAERQVDVVVP